MNNKLVAVLAAIAFFLLVFNPFYIVKETQRAVMLEFSRVVNADIKPGLHLRIPIINEVKKFDGRILTVDSAPQRYLTSEKEVLVVDSFAKWRVFDVKKFYTAVSGDVLSAEKLLSQQINDGLREQFGRRTKHEVVSEQRQELMDEIVARLDKRARKELGITVLDVRIKRIDLPTEVSNSVYKRMNTERARIAKETRSQGEEKAKKIRATADKEKTIILAEAYRDAEKTRGEGDAKAAAIYAAAYNKNPEFYAFLRSLKAYQKSFATKDDLIVLDSQSEFFKYLKNSR